jgi:hypothetical protein
MKNSQPTGSEKTEVVGNPEPERQKRGAERLECESKEEQVAQQSMRRYIGQQTVALLQENSSGQSDSTSSGQDNQVRKREDSQPPELNQGQNQRLPEKGELGRRVPYN